MSEAARRILIVDDHAPSRRLARLVLEGEGLHVDEATRGTGGLAMLAAAPYDCVLLDVSMPDMSGEDVCAAIRGNPAIAAIRLVAYTAHAWAHERDRILGVGFDDIVIKPATITRLVAAVGRAAHGPAPLP